MLKSRLIEAAIAADRSGDHITIVVKQGGVRVTLLRKVNGRIMSTENFTGWGAVEFAKTNPLIMCIRDLINQMNELEEDMARYESHDRADH